MAKDFYNPAHYIIIDDPVRSIDDVDMEATRRWIENIRTLFGKDDKDVTHEDGKEAGTPQNG